MERDPANKVVVITGGANGLGYEIAKHFLKEQAKIVIIVDINMEQGLRAVEQLNKEHGEGKAVFYKGDVTKDLEEVSGKIFKDYKEVDVLVNSAGIVDEKNVKRVIGINTIALVEWSMKFHEHMRTDKNGKGGTIINIGSIYSIMVDPFLVYYKTSKFAVLGFTYAMGHELNYKKFGVRLFTICPGLTETALTEGLATWKEHEEEFKELCNVLPWQKAVDVGEKTVEAFRKAESGSAWTIIGGVLDLYEPKGLDM